VKLRATTTDTDSARCIRALIAWMDGDKYALDVVLQEVMDDPTGTGTPGLLFELLAFGVGAAQTADPDIRDHLREALLGYEEGS